MNEMSFEESNRVYNFFYQKTRTTVQHRAIHVYDVQLAYVMCSNPVSSGTSEVITPADHATAKSNAAFDVHNHRRVYMLRRTAAAALLPRQTAVARLTHCMATAHR